MSFHIAALITSEKCGHCRTMRGDGILLTKAKIQKEKKPANLPGGGYYDAVFMKKLITAGTEVPRLRILNIHYKSFNPSEGVMDISVFTLEPDSKTVKQTLLKEKEGGTSVEIYVINDIGKKISTQKIETPWEDTVKTYIPPNLASYAFFYPTLAVFHFESWMHSIRTSEPVYGYVNGMPTKEELPYGASPISNPSPGDFVKFLKSFFDGTKTLLAKPEPKKDTPGLPSIPEEPKSIPSVESSKGSTKPKLIEVPLEKPLLSSSECSRLKIRLYVKE